MKKLNKKQKGRNKPKINLGSYSFVVGNGTSRKDFDLTSIKDYGTLIACNWFFKEEFRPDILVCSDEPISRTIQKVYPHYPKSNHFYTWFPKTASGAKKPDTPEKFSAGGLGTFIACDVVRSKKVFLIGMDFFGFGSNDKMDNGKLNNMYAGHKHYVKPKSDGKDYAPTYRNWQRRFEWILNEFSEVDFYHVAPFEGKSPERLRGQPNFHQVTWENLREHLEKDVELHDILEKTPEDVALLSEPNEDNIRASIERQLAGQNNSIMPDPFHPQQVLDLRKKAAEFYRKNGEGKGTPVIDIAGFQIALHTPMVQEGNIVRAPSDIEVETMWKREYSVRYTDKAEDGPSIPNPRMLEVPKRKPKPNLVPPPPPPPGFDKPTGFGDLPPPPPPKL